MFLEDIKDKLKIVAEIGFALCMISRDKLVVSGVKRILMCDNDCIKLKIENETLSIFGTKLSVEQIGGGDVYIQGVFNEVKFEEKT